MGPGSVLGENLRLAQQFQAHQAAFRPTLDQIRSTRPDAIRQLGDTLSLVNRQETLVPAERVLGYTNAHTQTQIDCGSRFIDNVSNAIDIFRPTVNQYTRFAEEYATAGSHPTMFESSCRFGEYLASQSNFTAWGPVKRSATTMARAISECDPTLMHFNEFYQLSQCCELLAYYCFTPYMAGVLGVFLITNIHLGLVKPGNFNNFLAQVQGEIRQPSPSLSAEALPRTQEQYTRSIVSTLQRFSGPLDTNPTAQPRRYGVYSWTTSKLTFYGLVAGVLSYAVLKGTNFPQEILGPIFVEYKAWLWEQMASLVARAAVLAAAAKKAELVADAAIVATDLVTAASPLLPFLDRVVNAPSPGMY